MVQLVPFLTAFIVISYTTLVLLQEYSTKQLQALISVGIGARISKRSRQKLLSLIDDK